MAPPTTDTSHYENDDYWIFGYGSLIWKPPPHFVSKLTAYNEQDRRVPGYIEGYVRRFWQASEDHRGTPAHPGRVVTLIASAFYITLVSTTPPETTEHEEEREEEKPPHRVHGAAYHIPRPHVRQVQEYLDIREINGYTMQYTTFYSFPSTTTPPSTPAPLPIKNILVYIGLPSNPQFLGPQSQDALAERIVRCKGPSGENREYLFMLRDALRDLHMGEGGREEDGSGGDGGGARVVGDPHVEDLAERVERLVEMEREEGGKGDGDGDGKVVERARSGGVVETS